MFKVLRITSGFFKLTRVPPLCCIHNGVVDTYEDLSPRSEPMSPIAGITSTWGNTDNAFSSLNDGSKIFIQGAAATPSFLLDGLVKYVTSNNLRDIQLYHMFTLGSYPFSEKHAEGRFSSHCYFVGQVNKYVPVTRGDASIHSSHIKYLVKGSHPLHETEAPEPSINEIRVAKFISEKLVEDGATIEAGIGSIPQGVYRQLGNHRHLGIHTEMFSDSLVDLVSVGAVTNAHKRLRPGKIVTSFVAGTSKVFDFIDNNPLVDMCDIEWVASPERIAINPKATCINTCLALDLSGQVASDSIGNYIYSGVGGVVDFMRGAAIGTDGQGKPIIGMTSRTKKGQSKIVPVLKPGTGVVLTRAHIHYVVTEYGIAYLFGRNLRQRAYSLIKIAHPDDREELEKAAYDNLKVMPSPD